MQAINVGKNVVRILNREFPVDTDLSMIRLDREVCAWHVQSHREDHQFVPLDDGEVSAQTFQTYRKALNTSLAFNTTGKMRELFERKERGVKIVPGHGVFLLPSKMIVVPAGQRKIKIKVFAGTSLAKEFQLSNYQHMVASASEYYSENFREFTDEVNESLYYPVMYNLSQVRHDGDMVIPQGIRLMKYATGLIEVYYKVTDNPQKYVGSSHKLEELKNIIELAVASRRSDLATAAIHRYVAPKFILLSQYMRSV